jgi:hypothetical protein
MNVKNVHVVDALSTNARHAVDPPVPSMLAIWRKCALKSESGTSAAKPLHSAAKRLHISAYFCSLNSDIPRLLKRRERLYQSSARQWTAPVMQLRWERGGYLASVIIQISEHVHDITNLQTTIGDSLAVSIKQLMPRGHHHNPHQSSVALQAPHCVQWMKRPCTWLSSACSKTVPQFPHT